MASSPADSAVKIFHNPDCGTSRNTLAMIRNAGIEPTIIEYLKTPPSRQEVVELLHAMNMPVRGLLRRKGTPYDELKLDEPRWTDDELLDLLTIHPILMNRPIVQTSIGTRLCRPSELVLEILPARQRSAFSKEDGEQVVDEEGNRVSP